MQTASYLYLIPLLPLLGAAFNLLGGKRLGRDIPGIVACAAVAGSMILAWIGFNDLRLLQAPAVALKDLVMEGDWLYASDGDASLHIRYGLVLDHLSSLFVCTITTIGFLIHLYSTAYMEHDDRVSTYFGYLNLFTGAMLILVLGDSLPVTFVGWEGVGLCSYLLIGFWFTKDANAYAGRKAFIVNRIGDFGFLLGMFLIFAATSTLNYAEINDKIDALRQPLAYDFFSRFGLRTTYATFAGLLLFVGATGKSAQIPLYVWLPDAMAGPTPVSALIHAATMVTAGIYMIARAHLVFEIDPGVQATIATVAILTAFFAATMGTTARPIKKILAYSTVSQLGFMFLGVGTANYTGGVFHVITHACFKAGLFLGAGSIMHALANEEDVFKMGGLRKKLPITHATYLIYCLAIAGIPPFAGFFSKDSILAGAFEFHAESIPHGFGVALYAIGLLTAAITAFYMFRSYFLVFWGSFRGDPHVYDHAHESPMAMAAPLVLLAIGSTLIGLIGVPEFIAPDKNLLAQWLEPAVFEEYKSHLSHGTEVAMTAAAVAVGVLGAALAWVLYGRGPSPAVNSIATSLGPVYRLVYDKYRIDELYDLAVVRPLKSAAYWLWRGADSFLIDTVLVRGLASVIDIVGRLARYVQNGDVQRYLVGVLVGTAAIIGVGANWTAMQAASLSTRVEGATVVAVAKGPPAGARRELQYVFDFGDGTPLIEQASPTARHAYASAGSHKVKLKVRDPRWQTSWSDSKTVVTALGGTP